jgi:hypothetical protein
MAQASVLDAPVLCARVLRIHPCLFCVWAAVCGYPPECQLGDTVCSQRYQPQRYQPLMLLLVSCAGMCRLLAATVYGPVYIAGVVWV